MQGALQAADDKQQAAANAMLDELKHMRELAEVEFAQKTQQAGTVQGASKEPAGLNCAW